MSEKPLGTDREVRSFLWARDPSIDRRFRPCPVTRKCLGYSEIEEEPHDGYSASVDSDLIENSTDEQSSKGLSSASGTQGNEVGAMVYLRFRPVDVPSACYQISDAGNVLITSQRNVMNTTCNNKNLMEKHYSFEAIFDNHVDQKKIYKDCVQEKIALEENFTILTYGTSGSGKTFTLLGDYNRPGIIPRALEQIFCRYSANLYPIPILKYDKARVMIIDDNHSMEELDFATSLLQVCPDVKEEYEHLQKIIHNDHDFEVTSVEGLSVVVWVSFVELYNENVYDLLASPPLPTLHKTATRKNLKIIGNCGKVFIKDITSVFVKRSLEAYQLLQYGLQRLTYASTAINENSSRSHCIFFVNVIKYFSSAIIQQFSYKFCDLAGSERLVKTGNVGSRLREAQSINTSLMVLGRCLEAATMAKRKRTDMIPYRDSKLTTLLQSSLLGKEKLTMIVNVMPTDRYYEENMNVLNFASKAKEITYKQPSVKENKSRYSLFLEKEVDKNNYIEQLLEENISLQNEVDRLQSLIDEQNSRHKWELFEQEKKLRNELVDSFESVLANKKRLYANLQLELEEQERMYEAKIATLKRKHESEIEELRLEWEEEKENEKEAAAKRSRRTLQ